MNVEEFEKDNEGKKFELVEFFIGILGMFFMVCMVFLIYFIIKFWIFS